MWTRSIASPLGAGVAIITLLLHPTPGFGQPARDTPALEAIGGAGTLSGRVVTMDTGAPLKRAVVSLQGEDVRDRRRAETNESGRYVFTSLAAGRYTLRVSKAGFVTLAYGQVHPRQPALPIQIQANTQLRGVDLALPRGSVLTGTVSDEDGEPMARALVLASRYVYRQGERQIEPAGTDETDDRGQFRVFDLEPGEYFVSVTVAERGARGGGGGPVGRGGRGGRAGPFANLDVGLDADTTGFAPTYYPGVTEIRQATPLSLGLSQVMSSVDFAAQLVPMARVAGVVIAPDGSPAAGTQIMLTSADDNRRMPGRVLGGRVAPDGSFDIGRVPPGRYRLEAVAGRGGSRRRQMFANHEVTVAGQDVTGVAVMLRRGARMNGTVEFLGNPGAVSADRVAVTTSPLVSPGVGQRRESSARVEPDGSFAISDIGPGPRLIRATGVPDGWQLEEVRVEGRNVIDTPLDLGHEDVVEPVVLVFTDQVTELTGTVRDDRGNAVTDFTVIGFTTDERLWGPRSRHILASRPDQNADYRLRGLPAGDYFLSVVDIVEEGEWFERRFLEELRRRATRVTLRGAQAESLNLTLDAER